MGRILALLLYLISGSALAANIPSPPSFVLGGSGVDNASALTLGEYSLGYSSPYFSISAGGTVTADQCVPFLKDGVPYQVSSGKAALCYGPVYSGSASSSWMQTMSATSTFTLGSCPTANPLYQGGASARYIYPVVTAFVSYSRRELIVFSGGRWPGVQYNSGAVVSTSLLCREIQ